jgi:hypothetical protein
MKKKKNANPQQHKEKLHMTLLSMMWCVAYVQKSELELGAMTS